VTEFKAAVHNLQALAMACENLGLRFQRGATHQRAYGGLRPAPAGTVGVIDVVDEKVLQGLRAKYHGQTPYSIAVAAKPDGSHSLNYDRWNDGDGLEDVIGEPASVDGEEVAAPTLMMHYAMMCDKLDAQAVGDDIDFRCENGAWYAHIVPAQARLAVPT
jgi:hypothetical protein